MSIRVRSFESYTDVEQAFFENELFMGEGDLIEVSAAPPARFDYLTVTIYDLLRAPRWRNFAGWGGDSHQPFIRVAVTWKTGNLSSHRGFIEEDEDQDLRIALYRSNDRSLVIPHAFLAATRL